MKWHFRSHTQHCGYKKSTGETITCEPVVSALLKYAGRLWLYWLNNTGNKNTSLQWLATQLELYVKQYRKKKLTIHIIGVKEKGN